MKVVVFVDTCLTLHEVACYFGKVHVNTIEAWYAKQTGGISLDSCIRCLFFCLDYVVFLETGLYAVPPTPY